MIARDRERLADVRRRSTYFRWDLEPSPEPTSRLTGNGSPSAWASAA
jgi:hypothetical protein